VPPSLQKAETVFNNGFIDMIVPRSELKREIGRLLLWHTAKGPIKSDKETPAKGGERESEQGGNPNGKAGAQGSPQRSSPHGQDGGRERGASQKAAASGGDLRMSVAGSMESHLTVSGSANGSTNGPLKGGRAGHTPA